MKKIGLSLLCLLTISCAPTIKQFDSYKKAPMLQAKSMPSEEAVEGQPVRVAIFELETNDIKLAQNTKLGSSLAVDIESILTKDKLVDLVDRKASVKLQKEVALAEMKSDKTYTGPAVADYIISGAISRTNFTSQYIAAQHTFNVESGTYSYTPPKWNYVSEVGGNIKIYEIPSLGIVRTFEIDGKSNMSENAKSKTSAKTEDAYLIKEASRDGLKHIKIDLKNFFAKKGYILEKRVLSNHTIFKISLGSKDGMKQGTKLVLYSKKAEENSITGSQEIIERKIAEAKIADIINAKSSWIIIKNKKDVEKIRLGDIVKVEYKKSFWHSAGKTSKGVGVVAVGLIGGLANVGGSSVSF